MRRRQRRLRQWPRHERLSVAMALAESTPRSPTGTEEGKGQGEEYEAQYTAKFRQHSSPKSPAHSTSRSTTTTVCRSSCSPGLTASPRLGRRSGFSGAQWNRCGDSAPFLPSLDVPVPLRGQQLVVVYKLLDVMGPEQVIEVPKIFVGDIPPRRLCREPQMVDQLVTAPTNPDTVLCVITRSLAPPAEDQLVEVPPIVPQLVGFSAGADEYVWLQLSGPTGAYWRVGSSHTQWAPPPGYTARPGRDRNTGRRDAG